MNRPRIGVPECVVFAVLLALGAGLRLWNLGGHSLWYDELATWMYGTTSSIPEFFRTFRATDQNPPGYFLISWLLAHGGVLGDGEASLRSISAVCGLCSVVAIFWTTRKSFGTMTALLAMGFLSVHYHAVVLSQEARPYSLLLVLTILHVGAAFRSLGFDSVRGTWVSGAFAALTGAAMAYTHAFGLFFLFFFGLAIFIFSDRRADTLRRWFAVYAGSVLLFSPWIVPLLAVAQGRTRSFFGAPDMNDVIDHWYHLFGHARLAAVLFLIGFAIVLRQRRPIPPTVRVLLTAVAATYFFAFVGSHLGPSFLAGRYLLALTGPWIMVCAWLATEILRERSRVAIALVTLCALDAGQVLWGRHYYTEPKNEQNREAVEQALAWSSPDHPVFIISANNNEKMALYYPRRLGVSQGLMRAVLPTSEAREFASLPTDDVALISHGEAWADKAAEGLSAAYEPVKTASFYRVTATLWKRKPK